MKISEMTNDQATEAMIRISVPMSNICDDDEAVALLNDIGNVGKTPLVKAIGQLIPRAVTYCLKKHKDDLYEIIGALTFKPTAEVGNMNFAETCRVVKDSYDETLANFFTSSAVAAKMKDEKLQFS